MGKPVGPYGRLPRPAAARVAATVARNAAPGDASEDDAGEGKRLRPPRMQRARGQLATVYAPGALFTFEGGQGICAALPLENPLTLRDGDETKRQLLIEHLREFVQNWRIRAEAARTGPPVYLPQCLDDAFLHYAGDRVDIDPARFEFTDPTEMGYAPYPLLYRCDRCGVLREYRTAYEQQTHALPAACASGGECRWRQVDVVFVHWSGTVEPLSPYRYEKGAGVPRKIWECRCGNKDFALVKRGVEFRNWRFRCTACRTEREVTQADPFTLDLLKPRMAAGHTWGEINMLPVSYRATSVFFPQGARFIPYQDRDAIDMMMLERHADLAERLALRFGARRREPSDKEIEAAVAGTDPQGWGRYQKFRAQASRFRNEDDAEMAQHMEGEADKLLEGWSRPGGPVRCAVEVPAGVRRGAEARRDWARRFDPFRLALEHEIFEKEKLASDPTERRRKAVDLRQPDPDLVVDHDDPVAQECYRRSAGAGFAALGLETMVLLRGLEVCDFTFGFSRVSPGPTTDQKDGRMPVRLRAFPPFRSGKRPIYLVDKRNEAFYVKLDERRVAAWLAANGIAGVPSAPPRRLGMEYLERYEDFGPFLEAYRVTDATARRAARGLPSLTYGLLHTLAHHMIHVMSELSGLDRDSLGEHIFPADLAFVVYRKVVTPDMGNLSAMWRNYADAFFGRSLDPRSLRCGSGHLCDHKGGACPACVMIPEVSCIAGNQLLSRAYLIGGPAPLWDADRRDLHGYFPFVAEERRREGAAGGGP